MTTETESVRPVTVETCSVCRRGDAPVCDRCRLRTAEQLAALPGLHDRLRSALVPGPGGGGERVSTGKGEAPMPARLAALTLLAGGSDEARCLFVPAVRVWVEPHPGGGAAWHREPVHDADGRPVMALADDQSGVLPVRVWLAAWALEWRLTLGHSSGVLHGRQRHTAPPAERAPGWGPATLARHAYLTQWLAEATDRPQAFADFAASLRTLTGALRAALGDIDDVEYLGRCPDEAEDRATHARSVCGAPIWHDPYASVITCPRCRTETGRDRSIWLARRILDAWPIDRRRRYPRGLIDILRDSTCGTCATRLDVEWIDATERADRERFWRPGRLTCPTGCEVAQ